MNNIKRGAVLAAIATPMLLLAATGAQAATCVDVKGTPAVPAVPAVTHDVTVVDAPAVPATEGSPAIPAVTHTETVIDTPATPAVEEVSHTETVVDTAAYDEVVIDTAAYDETVHHAAVTHVVHHPAVTHVVHHAAVTHLEYQYIKQVRTNSGNDWFPYDGDCKVSTHGDAKPAWSADTDANTAGIQVPGIWSSGTFTLDAVGPHDCGQYRYHAIDTKTVTDTAAFDETVTDTAAFDEIVIDTAAFDETVHHAAITHTVHHDAVTHDVKVIDTAASPAVLAVTHDVTVVDHAAIPAVPATPFIPAVTHVETIVDSPALPGQKAIPAKDCPTALPHTGGSGQADFAMAAAAGLLIMGGAGSILVSRRKRNS